MTDHPQTADIDASRDLVLTRLIDASPETLFRCWTEPALIKQWFAPKPWTTPKVESDLRVGGATTITMADEQGNIDLYARAGLVRRQIVAADILDRSFTDAIRAGNTQA